MIPLLEHTRLGGTPLLGVGSGVAHLVSGREREGSSLVEASPDKHIVPAEHDGNVRERQR